LPKEYLRIGRYYYQKPNHKRIIVKIKPEKIMGLSVQYTHFCCAITNRYKKVINKIRNSFSFVMRAAIFETPGLENLKVIDNAEEPKIGDHDILIKVKMTGVNPIDHFVTSGTLPKVNPLPHIPGAESSGIV
jgi:hypothetical protein